MVYDLLVSVKKLLEVDLPVATGDSNIVLRLDPPDLEFQYQPDSNPPLKIFLYDILKNKNRVTTKGESAVVPGTQRVNMLPPPRRLDCSWLMLKGFARELR